MKTQTIVALQL